jgi:hypothetical protein
MLGAARACRSPSDAAAAHDEYPWNPHGSRGFVFFGSCRLG